MGFELLSNNLNNFTKYLCQLSQKIDITFHEIEVENTALNGLIIAQISDLHMNNWNVELIEHTIETVNKISPDIVAISGDIICNGKKFLPDLTRLFQEIDCKYGKFACLGNHDHSDGEDGQKIQQTYKNADFQLLLNQSAKLNIKGETLYIAGADDLELGNQDIYKTVHNIPPDAASIFLIHNPYNFSEFAKFNPDLVLAGHTHGGQLGSSIVDFVYKTVIKSRYVSGLYELGKSLLYVNKGIGTAMLSFTMFNKKFLINTPRLYIKPEISVFKLVSNSKSVNYNKRTR